MAGEEKGGGLMLVGPPSSSDAALPSDVASPEVGADVDPEQEAYVAAARDVLAAVESKDVNALAAALRAAASIGHLSGMDLD